MQTLSATLPPDTVEFLDHAADTSASVLLEGETGVGKSYLARILHRLSDRSSRRFVRVDCAAIPDGIFEREMFGHTRGAFTGADRSEPGHLEEADGGTLMLDEVAEVPLPSQAKLLSVAEGDTFRRLGSTREVPVSVRIVAATNQDLDQAVANGSFRRDLFERLSDLRHTIAPLRERLHQLSALIHVISDQIIAERVVRGVLRFPDLHPEVVELLHAYPWPGNLRELKKTLRCGLIFSGGAAIEPRHLPEAVREPEKARAIIAQGQGVARESGRTRKLPGKRYIAPASLADEREAIIRALRDVHGNKTHAAKRLDMSRQTLLVKLLRHRIEAEEWT